MTNEELMLEYIKGNQGAFDQLFERIHHRVYSYVARRLIFQDQREDVVQSIFLKFHQTKEKYDVRYPLDAWIFIISRSVLFDHLRKVPKLQMEEFTDFMLEDVAGLEVRDMDELIKNLQHKGQEVIRYKFLSDMSFEEIAKKLNTTSSNVRQILSRALRSLRKENGV